MEKEFIENALNVMKFNIVDEEKDLIQFVPMREYRVANDEKPLLLTINLQSCIALVAYTKGFSFLAHMNCNKGNWNEDFNVGEENNIISCKRVEDLYNEIIKNKDKITEPISIGLVLGVTPLEKDYASRQVLERDLTSLFERLSANNAFAVRLPDISSFSFILNSRSGEIMHDGVENKNKVTSIKRGKRTTNRDEIIR